MNYTLEQVRNAVKSKGYVWFEDEKNLGYDVNIVAIRNSSTDDKVTNLFDDTITISFKENGNFISGPVPRTQVEDPFSSIKIQKVWRY